MARNEITNSADVIDSRDVIARIEELEGEREALAEAAKEAETELQDHPSGEEEALRSVIAERIAALTEWDESEEAAELKALKALAEEAEGYVPDWRHGAPLIRHSYFQAYAEELAEDIGAVDAKLAGGWPYGCIDWEKAADELKQDYTAVDFDGVEYWAR